MAKASSTSPKPDSATSPIPDPAFHEQVTITPGLDTKTYRLANRARTPDDERALAERLLALETAPEALKAQARAVLAA